MRSGNGKHRRPRQAPAVLVSAGATGAGLALPLLGAVGAQAADADTWDRVAHCESGGVWSADHGNGYYGGLQITLRTWRDHGGTVYAERPDLASRSQQIAVAERILADEGPAAWPRCAERAGLTDEGTAAPEIDPGLELPSLIPDEDGERESTTEAPSDEATGRHDTRSPDGGRADQRPEGDVDRDAGSPEASPRPSGDASGAPSDDPSDPAADGAPDAPAPGDGRSSGAGDTGDFRADQPDRPDAREGTGKHRGPRDPREVERERQGAPAERAPGERAPGERVDRGERVPSEYRVRVGDSLSLIAERYELPGGWPTLYADNREVVGEDPDLILPGQRLDLTVGDGHGGQG